MATWDGSYSGPDDQNYYVYSDQNASESAARNWTFFPSDINNDYLRSNGEFYVQNDRTFEQSNPNVFYHSNANVIPNLLTTTNSYCESATNTIDNAQVLSNQGYFPNIVKSEQQYRVPESSWKHNYDLKQDKTKHNFTRIVKEVKNSVANKSNLHVMAEEFVPNNKVSDDKREEFQDTKAVNGENSSIKDSNGDSDKYLFSNANRHERKYVNKRNLNYKPKEEQQDRYYKRNGYKNFYQQQGKASHKFQGNKYFTNKCYSDQSQINVKGINEEALNKHTTDNSIACSSKSSSAINLSKGESKNLSNTNGQRLVANNKSAQDEQSIQQSNNHIKQFAYNYSDLRQPYGNHRNVRKYRYNGKYNREENSCKERRRHYQAYSAESDSKEDKFKTELDQNRKCDESKEYFNNGIGVEPKETNEKRHNYNGSREHNKESTIGIKEKDKIKYCESENKEKGSEHWRYKREVNERIYTQKRRQSRKLLVDDDASQRERLTDQLNRGQLECLVCCEYIKQNDYVWSCSNCYHVLHLKCIKKWAKSSQAENGWRCPACQNVNLIIPEDYFCFCGKTKTPEWNRRDVAHSCGEICGRILSKNSCPHKCTLLCHPGSCPQCTAMVTKYCGCGKTSQTVQCSTHKLLLCDSICDKDLNCGRHKCEANCHYGECANCEKTITQVCHCGKNTREVTCQSNVSSTYSCENVCGRLLECGNHTCTKKCHTDACDPCSLSIEKITTCCCGQTPLTDKRQSCLDLIPVCDKICSKNLKCGQPSEYCKLKTYKCLVRLERAIYNPHKCRAKCHQGDCPACDLTTDVKCRCGNMDREIACKDLTSKADDARCEKRCTKKRSCGKHKCNQLCCIEIEHICPLICSKTLSCGRHKCEQSCHKGRCPPCWHSSFDELYCECGASVIYPPVPCGTRRPTCDRPCSRQRACGHEVLHNCHSEPTCPPCTVLTQRWCHGKHELRKAVPCHLNEISCGLPCNKPISCGRHKCITICHSGPCEKPGQQCSQPCTTPREMCGHICAAPCHEGKCPDTPCKEMVKVTCQCGHRTMSRVCAENSKEYQRIASSILASKMADMQLGHSINLEEVFGLGAKKQNQLKTLECNDECKIIERNRRLALGLQIVNPDLGGKLMPRYSDFMKQWAKKDPHFCQMVHEKLTELVQLAKTSKQKSRSYSFDSMNKDKRHFVHESCEHFGCESQAYDQEPKRNVVATAVKDKCWLPSYSLLEIIQRENGQRKVPGPMLNTLKTDGSVKTILSLPTKKIQKLETPFNVKNSEPEIDYFDYQG